MDHSHAHLLSKYIQQVFAQCGKVCKYISKSHYLYKQTCIQCRFYILAFAQCSLKLFLYYAKQKYSRTYCMYVYVYLDRKCPVNTCGKLENPKFFILILFSDCLFFWRFNVSKLCSKYFGWLLLSNGNKKYHFSPQCMLCSMYEKFETCNL